MKLARRLLLVTTVAGLALPGAALAETVTVTGITLTWPGLQVEIPTIEAVDANRDEAAIRAMFADATLKTLFEGLVTLDAAAIRIPEITLRSEVPASDGAPSYSSESTYFDLELRGVKAGIADAASIGTVETTTADIAAMTMGTTTVDHFDMGALLSLYGLGPEPRGDAMKRVYESFTMAGATLRIGDFTCEVGPATSESYSVRPIKGSFNDLIAATADLAKAEAGHGMPSPESIAALVEFYADFFTASQSSPITFDALSCYGSTPEGRPARVSAAGFGMGGFEPGFYPELSVDGLRVEADDVGWFEVGNFTWKPVDLRAPIANLLAAKDQLSEKWFEENWRKVIPSIEGFSVAGLALDVPNPEEPGKRVQLSIGALDLTLSDYSNGLPATIVTHGSNIVATLPETGEGSELRRAGYERVDLTYDIAARWIEGEKEIVVDSFSLSGAGMGGITLNARIGNAVPELFSFDEKVSAAAADGLTLKELTIDIENGSLTPALISLSAVEQGQDPQVFHAGIAIIARALPIGVLGPSPDSIALGSALGSFLAGAPNLRITVSAVDPAGLGLAELMAAEDDPAALKGKVTVKAEASGEPVPFVWPEILPAPVEEPSESRTDPTTDEDDQPPVEIAPPVEKTGPRPGKLDNRP